MDLEVELFGKKLRTPFIAASGTFGYGDEYEFVNYDDIGAFVTKGLSLNASNGNPTPRIAELETGLLNSIGLQNIGIKSFIRDKYPKVSKLGPELIVNFFGRDKKEYVEVVRILNTIDILAVEVNVSCPNVDKGGQSFGEDPLVLYSLIKSIKKESRHPVIVKLTPNITDIKVIAQASIDGGADAISLINTVKGLAIDIENVDFMIPRRVAGYSGKGIKPIALRMVYEVLEHFKNIPVIGLGGIYTYQDVLEFMMLGVRAVQVGSAIFKNPNIFKELKVGLLDYMDKKSYKSIFDIPKILQ